MNELINLLMRLVEAVIGIGLLVGAFLWVKSDVAEGARKARETQAIIESEEFKKKLQEAKKLKEELQSGVSSSEYGGFVTVMLYNIDHPEKKDYDDDFYIYFRVRFNFVPWIYVRELRKSGLPEDAKRMVMNDFLRSVIGKDEQQIRELGLDPADFVYDIEKDENEESGFVYLKFICPHLLKGDKRELFFNKI